MTLGEAYRDSDGKMTPACELLNVTSRSFLAQLISKRGHTAHSMMQSTKPGGRKGRLPSITLAYYARSETMEV